MKRYIKSSRSVEEYDVFIELDVSSLADDYELPIAASYGTYYIDHPIYPVNGVERYSEEKLEALNTLIGRVISDLEFYGMRIVKYGDYDDIDDRSATHPSDNTYSYYINTVWEKNEEIAKFNLYVSVRDHGFKNYPKNGVRDRRTQSYRFRVDVNFYTDPKHIDDVDAFIENHVTRFKQWVMSLVDLSEELIQKAEKAADSLGMEFKFIRTRRKPIYLFTTNDGMRAELDEVTIEDADSTEDIESAVMELLHRP